MFTNVPFNIELLVVLKVNKTMACYPWTASYPGSSLSMKMCMQALRFITSHSRFGLASAMRKTKRLRRRLILMYVISLCLSILCRVMKILATKRRNALDIFPLPTELSTFISRTWLAFKQSTSRNPRRPYHALIYTSWSSSVQLSLRLASAQSHVRYFAKAKDERKQRGNWLKMGLVNRLLFKVFNYRLTIADCGLPTFFLYILRK